MPISPISNIAKFSHNLGNPDSTLSTFMIEVPTDLGRSYAGYKRGGIIEGSEKLRKEALAAVVWLFGINAFKKLGDVFCEEVLKIPMNMAFSNKKEGNDAIKNSVEYLTSNGRNILGDFKDTSGLDKYFKDGVSKFNGLDTAQLIKKVNGAKIVTSLAAVGLNCLLLGFLLPLFNQKLTQKKLGRMKNKNSNQASSNNKLKVEGFDEFQKRTNQNNITFKGGNGLVQGAGKVVDLVENSVKFRLVATDVPMIIGRMATSRNKYEALEYLLMDGSGIFLYNFCSPLVQKVLRNATGLIDVDAMLADSISNFSADDLKNAINTMDSTEGQEIYRKIQSELKAGPSIFKRISDKIRGIKQESKTPQSFAFAKTLFDDSKADEIYKTCTYDNWGKINAYVKHSTVNKIDESVIALLQKIKETSSTVENGKVIDVNLDKVKSLIKKTNQKTLAFQLVGWLVAMFGLAYAAPKITYWITSKLTGKNEFAGLADYDDEKK